MPVNNPEHVSAFAVYSKRKNASTPKKNKPKGRQMAGAPVPANKAKLQNNKRKEVEESPQGPTGKRGKRSIKSYDLKLLESETRNMVVVDGKVRIQTPKDDKIPQLVAPPQPSTSGAPSKKKPAHKNAIPHNANSAKAEDNPKLEAEQLFQWMVAPIATEAFFSDYWEQQPLHIMRDKPKYFSHILDSTQLDRIFRENLLHYTRNVDVVAYEDGKKEVVNQEGRAVPTALWDFYSNGCSIRLLNPHTYNHKVHLLIATLQEFFGAMVGANVYLTPPGSQGFAPHFDDIEAFVVQLEGRKHWKLYHPKGKDVLARDSSPNFTPEEIGEPFMELTLEAGDILYFPRGTIHEGHTDDKSHSLHITVSVYQHTAYADLMEQIMPLALKKAAENNVEFRKGLPLNYLKKLGKVNQFKKSKERDMVTKNVKKLLHSLVDHMDIDGAIDQLGRKFLYDSMPPVPSKSEAERSSLADGDHLVHGKVRNRIEIGPDTKVRLLRYHCARVVAGDGETPPKLYYNTENAKVYHGEEEQWLELDPAMVEMVQALQSMFPKYIEVQLLPTQDLTVKLQLVSCLWERGILVTEQQLPCSADEDEDDDDDEVDRGDDDEEEEDEDGMDQ